MSFATLFTPARRLVIIRAALLILVSITPVLVSLILVNSRSNGASFYPHANDEVSYWHQTLTATRAGFQGGYYSTNELAAPGFSHYYFYGPWYPMLYAGLSSLVGGWQHDTALLINSVLFTAAVAAYCIAMRLSNKQLIVVLLLLATFWPFQLYLFSNMQDILHQIIAIIGALIFYHLIRLNGQVSRRVWIAMLIFWIIAVILRLSWAILLPAFFWLTGWRSRRGFVLLLGSTLVITLIASIINNYVGAPGNNSISLVLGTFRVSISHGLNTLWQYFVFNLRLYLGLGSKDPMDSLLTVQVIALLFGSILFIYVLLRRRRRRGISAQSTVLRETSFHAYNLFVILGSSLTLYVIASWGDYRVISTHLMLSLLLMVSFKRYIPVALVIISNVLMVTVFLNTFDARVMVKFHEQPPPEMAEFYPVAQQFMTYDPEAENPWCNTVLYEVGHYDVGLMGVPAGIGLTFFNEPRRLTLPMKSYYVLLDDAMLARFDEFEPPLDLTYVAQTSRYTLYTNNDADCPTRQES